MSAIKVTNKNFEQEVMKASKPVLLDFFAVWCMPCQRVSPLVEEIAEEYPQYIVGKVNVDEEEELAQRFGVTSIPTLVVIKNGKVLQTAVGARTKSEILNLLQ